jgi:hypothetical protein
MIKSKNKNRKSKNDKEKIKSCGGFYFLGVVFTFSPPAGGSVFTLFTIPTK